VNSHSYLCWEREPGIATIAGYYGNESVVRLNVESGKLYYILAHIGPAWKTINPLALLWQDERSHPKIGYERSINGATEAVKETFLLKPLWKTYGENVFDLRDKEKTAEFIQGFLGDFLQLIK